MVKVGDKIIVETTWNKLNNAMPTPNAPFPYGMSLINEDEDMEAFLDSFLSGTDVRFYANEDSYIDIHYGGKITITYNITKETLEDFDVTTKDFESFIKKLKTLGDVKIVKIS